MSRIVITETDEYTGERTVLGHFDLDKAEGFNEDTRWDGNNNVSVHTSDQFAHQRLLRTAGGRWVLHEWSQWQGSKDVYSYVSDEKAREWLLINDDENVIEKYFGEIEEEKGPGRPEIGPTLKVAFEQELIDAIDEAKQDGESRSAAIRRLLRKALT